MLLLVGLPALILAFPGYTHLHFRRHINCRYPELVKFFFMCIDITLNYFNKKKIGNALFLTGDVTNNYW